MCYLSAFIVIDVECVKENERELWFVIVIVTVELQSISFGEHLWGTEGEANIKQTSRSFTLLTCGHPTHDISDVTKQSYCASKKANQRHHLRSPQVF